NYAGLDRFAARQRVMQDLEAAGLVEKVEDYTVPTALCARCHTVIEPLLSEQWFVKMKELAQPAIDVVKADKVEFVPDRFGRTYLDWMENIRDWTISRQLWWGHRIPVGHTEDGEYIVARSEAEAQAKAAGRPITQDEDVLDTWFSSQLWPHAVLGWPERTADLETYYPTSVLITARDIIYLWVSRMIMTGIDFVGGIPFHDVYIYATVLDEQGRRQSKSLGTGVDPLEVTALYGTDALRFALLIRAAKGQDIRFAAIRENRQPQVEEARNFANKIWNATRFVLMNLGDPAKVEAKWEASDALADRWILAELNATVEQVTAALADYRLNEAAQTLYHFFWDEFCDWYIEFSKTQFAAKEETAEVCAARNRIVYVLETSLRLLHPLMPFITEELWQRLPHEGESIMVAAWPEADARRDDREAREQMETLISLITKVRNIRSVMNIPVSAWLQVHIASTDARAKSLVTANAEQFKRLARVEAIHIGDALPPLDDAARDIVAGMEIAVPFGGFIDKAKERERVSKEIARKENEVKGMQARLGNPSFVDRAPREVVEQTRARHDELMGEISKLQATLKALGA
ncbi:MAG TPA: class I tRNA ligase family protein, partial [Blastocatellia bacterium]